MNSNRPRFKISSSSRKIRLRVSCMARDEASSDAQDGQGGVRKTKAEQRRLRRRFEKMKGDE